MKDFPFFTTQSGIASLVLKQIPYNGKAYVTIRDGYDVNMLLKECCDFCRAAGAVSVLASGHSSLERYPLQTTVITMQCMRQGLGDTDVALFPVQDNTLGKFREIYNEGMRNVELSAYMSVADAEKVLSAGNGYFAHCDGELIGIGIAGGERIDAIVSVIPGRGKDVLLALNHALSGDCVEVEVATSNTPAVKLYEKLGFIPSCELSRWYKVF